MKMTYSWSDKLLDKWSSFVWTLKAFQSERWLRKLRWHKSKFISYLWPLELQLDAFFRFDTRPLETASSFRSFPRIILFLADIVAEAVNVDLVKVSRVIIRRYPKFGKAFTAPEYFPRPPVMEKYGIPLHEAVTTEEVIEDGNQIGVVAEHSLGIIWIRKGNHAALTVKRFW